MRRNNLEPPDSRRAFRRNADIACEIFTRGADRPFMGRITDISPYGVGVLSRHSFSVGHRFAVGETVIVKMRPPSPGGRELSLLAELVHRGVALLADGQDEDKIGLEFLDVGERRRDDLEMAFHRLRRPRMNASAAS